MMPARKSLLFLIAAFVLNFLGAGMLLADSGNGLALTALDRYVRAPDDKYRYSVLQTIDGDGYTTYVLEMISQQW